MSAKPVVVLAGLLLVGGLLSAAAPAHAKPSLPTVLLFPASANDVPAMADLRTRLRLDGVFQVLSYDSDSSTVKRIAAEGGHPEWLVGSALTDDQRLALARALGVVFYVLIAPGREADGTHLQLVQTAPPALTFDWYGVNRQVGARALESQAQAAVGHVAADTGDAVSLVYTEPTSLPTAAAAPVPVAASAPALPAVKPAPVLVARAPTSPKTALPITSAPIPLAAYVPAPDSVPIVMRPVPPRVQAPPAPTTEVEVADVPPPIAPVPVLMPAPAPAPVAEPAPAALPPVAAEPVAVEPVTPPVVAAPVVAPAPVPEAAPAAPKETRVAMLPPPDARPEPAPPTETLTLAPVVRPILKAEDLAAITPLMTRGDVALEGGDVVGAISLFRQAVNGAPLSVVPRLKLAAAYQKGGLTDKALDEAKRALEIAPDSPSVQQFLTEIDTQNGTSDGALTRYRALAERNPDDPTAHAGLAESLWNDGDLDGAEREYKAAKKLAPTDDHSADAHLAQLYATQARYDDCLAALKESGTGGYALAIKIVRSRADTLSSTIEASRGSFSAGKSTREQFYDGAKKVSAQAGALAAFVTQVTPPAQYKLSHLHRMLSTNLIAQEAATLVAFIETGDAAQSDSISKLDKNAQTEMLTAQATETKLGLWEAKP